MRKKTDHNIEILKHRISKLSAKKTQLEKQLIDLQNKKKESSKISNSQSYKNHQELTKKILKILSKINYCDSFLSRYDFRFKKYQSIKNIKGKFNAEELYDFLQQIEKSSHKWLPTSLFIIFIINRYKSTELRLQDYLEWLKIQGKTKKIENVSKRIQYSQFQIKDHIETFNNKMIFRLLKKLDHLKKPSNLEGYDSKTDMIFLKNVSKYYYNKQFTTKVLKDIDLVIKKGEFVTILGPSGSGKTTLLNIISGMDNATYGTTMIANNELINLSSNQLTKFRRDNIGYVFQQYGLLPGLTVKENAEMGANLQSDKSRKINIEEILKMIGIYEHKDKYPAELSGGQQQRVSIARSVAKSPNILFADEPTGAVDEATSKKIIDLFLSINKTLKMTIIMVTHNPIFSDIANRVIKVNDGKIIKVIVNKKPKSVDHIKWFS